MKLTRQVVQYIQICMVAEKFYPTNLFRSESVHSDNNTATNADPIGSKRELSGPYSLADLSHTKFSNTGVTHPLDNRSSDKLKSGVTGSRDLAHDAHYYLCRRSGSSLHMPLGKDAHLTYPLERLQRHC